MLHSSARGALPSVELATISFNFQLAQDDSYLHLNHSSLTQNVAVVGHARDEEGGEELRRGLRSREVLAARTRRGGSPGTKTEASAESVVAAVRGRSASTSESCAEDESVTSLAPMSMSFATPFFLARLRLGRGADAGAPAPS